MLPGLAAQVKRGIHWLAAPRQEYSRLAGVLVLKELAENAPAVFNVHVRWAGWVGSRRRRGWRSSAEQRRACLPQRKRPT